MRRFIHPFTILRAAYQHALDTVADNPNEPERVRDYWPECVRIALEESLEAM